MPAVIPLLRWQFELTWSLLDYHLAALTDDDCRWEPADPCWSVRPDADGRWLPDWVEPEPDPAPATTIGWVSWHIGWWWGETLARATGNTAPPREEVSWPGDAASTVSWLRGLRDQWLALLDRCTDDDLARVAPFPWQGRDDRTVAHMIGWVNAELMKNTAELGQLRLLRLAVTG